MQLKFQKHIEQRHLINEGDRLILAVSGGVDSVVLAYLVEKLNNQSVIAHCNFRLREKEADQEEEFARKLANKLHMPFYVRHFDTLQFAKEQGVSVQMAARELRYSYFHELLSTLNFNKILTAHHLDDQLETFFINLLRGSGISGLTGIPEINGQIVRPLLPFSRDQIIRYAAQNQIEFKEDSSNMETKYLRNQLRHILLPRIKDHNPGFQSSMKWLLHEIIAVKNRIDLEVEKFAAQHVIKEPTLWRISTEGIRKQNHASIVLFELLKSLGFSWSQMDMVNKLCNAPSGKKLFSPTYVLLKDRSDLIIYPIPKNKSSDSWVFIDLPSLNHSAFPLSGQLCEVNPVYKNNIDQDIVYLDADRVKFPLVTRKWVHGDYFFPLGMKSKKRLSDFFIDEKFSLYQKSKVLILLSENSIVWILGHRLDNRYKITSNTKRILKLKFFKNL